jgi:hypothetical protein
MINYNTRQEIISQALKEIEFARTYKQGKTKNWKENERLYFGQKNKSIESRANVDLGLMPSFVHTLMSKIDNPLIFKFSKRKKSQLRRVEQLNRLRVIDADKDFWDIKDLVGKKQAIIYGRAIFSYYADSYDGYCPHLENVDVYDFLIDPSTNGIDIETAFYMGRYGVVKTKQELEKGIKDKIYLRTETTNLIEGNGNSTESNQEEQNKQDRTYMQNVWNAQKDIDNPDKYKFWEWYTTYKGERYYLLLNERGATAVRVEKLKDIFESELYPFWTWAVFPDLTEFWTPSYCDYVREPFMAQATSINQMLDNAEQINKPQKVVNVSALENLAELKYRRDGVIRVKNAFDVDKAIQFVRTPSIDSPLKVYDVLDAIQEKASGVTAGAKGVAEEDKVGIYEGNQANAADRFGLLNKAYAFGYKRFATLWISGVKEHLIKKVAIDILGADGIEVIEVSRKDLFRKGDEYSTLVESSTAELSLSEAEKRTKLMFLGNNTQNPMQNPQKAYEIQATIAGFDDETIRQLMDKSEFGNANIMSEAERDIEYILDGKKVEPNQHANTAYKQRFVDYMTDQQEKISQEQFVALATYIEQLEPIIYRNMMRMANDKLLKDKLAMVNQQEGASVGGGQPTELPQEKPNISEENYAI